LALNMTTPAVAAPAVALSVLDLAPIPTGSDAGSALRASTELAQHVERLGFRRFWVAEHHNMPGIASSSPAVLLAHIAAATHQIRVGSGGVMLPNHAPLVVAEQFGTLAALHPDRVDLGIGRAPGTDQLTAFALRRTMQGLDAEQFPQELADLFGFLTDGFAESHPFRRIGAVPRARRPPEVWLLGSSDYSARLAGRLGLPFCYAHHFSAAGTVTAMSLYRENFQPSAYLDAPHGMIAVSVICAEDDARARELAAPFQLSFLRLRAGRRGPLPTPQEAADHPYTTLDRQLMSERIADQAIGSPDTVRARLTSLLAATRADELMLTTTVFDPADRLRSFDLIATHVAPSLRPAAPRA
jgi:luciferase family oxidoreductase group 1